MARKAKKHGRHVQTTIKTWSTDETKFPDAWTETMEQLNHYCPSRIVGFSITVWLAPVPDPISEGE